MFNPAPCTSTLAAIAAFAAIALAILPLCHLGAACTEDEFSDEQIRNFQIEKMDMDKLTNKVCEIIADFEDNGVLQSELWKKLKLNTKDGSRLALRLERRGLISREKLLQKGRWTYKLIIEQAPIKRNKLS